MFEKCDSSNEQKRVVASYSISARLMAKNFLLEAGAKSEGEVTATEFKPRTT